MLEISDQTNLSEAEVARYNDLAESVTWRVGRAEAGAAGATAFLAATGIGKALGAVAGLGTYGSVFAAGFSVPFLVSGIGELGVLADRWPQMSGVERAEAVGTIGVAFVGGYRGFGVGRGATTSIRQFGFKGATGQYVAGLQQQGSGYIQLATGIGRQISTLVSNRGTTPIGTARFTGYGAFGRGVAPKAVYSKVQVTSWRSVGRIPDLSSGRWVQVGKPTVWNYIKTGLWGGKFELGLSSRFPWVFKWSKPTAPFSNYITGFVEQTSLMWPKGIDVLKGFLGQRRIK